MSDQCAKKLLDSIGYGLLIFDKNGICGPIYSKSCLDLLETDPASKHIAEVLKIPQHEKEDFNFWINLIFSEVLDFNDSISIAPKKYPHSSGRIIELTFQQYREESQTTEGIILIAKDKTKKEEKIEELKKKEKTLQMILKISKERNNLLIFIKKTREMIKYLKKQRDINELKRILHTIKGGASFFYIENLKNLAHSLESELSKTIKQNDECGEIGEKYSNLIKNELDFFLNEQIDIIGENFENQSYLKKIEINTLFKFLDEIKKRRETHELVSSFFFEIIDEPIESFFFRFNSILQELSIAEEKKINPILLTTEKIKILPEFYQDFFDELIHIFRNIVSHGIEPHHEREKIGKPIAGTVKVSIKLEETKKKEEKILNIEIEDDGRGISAELIRTKLKFNYSIDTDLEKDSEIIQHIFDMNFTTKESITDISGRGVGLSILKKTIEKMGGNITVKSTTGINCAFIIKIPYIWRK